MKGNPKIIVDGGDGLQGGKAGTVDILVGGAFEGAEISAKGGASYLNNCLKELELQLANSQLPNKYSLIADLDNAKSNHSKLLQTLKSTLNIVADGSTIAISVLQIIHMLNGN